MNATFYDMMIKYKAQENVMLLNKMNAGSYKFFLIQIKLRLHIQKHFACLKWFMITILYQPIGKALNMLAVSFAESFKGLT